MYIQKQNETSAAEKRLTQLGEVLLRNLIKPSNVKKWVDIKTGKTNKTKIQSVLQEIFNKNKKKVESIMGVKAEKSFNEGKEMTVREQELKLRITELVKKHAPEGTSDEEIEKQIARVTAAAVRALGAAGKKLKSLVGRVVQRFRGKNGVWVTQNGRRVFIEIGAKAKGVAGAAAAGVAGAASKVKAARLNRKSKAIQRRWLKGTASKAETEFIANQITDAIGDALKAL